MERYFQKINYFLVVLVFTLFSSNLFGQTPSVVRNIRIPLWAELDAYPGSEEANDNAAGRFDYPQKKIQEVAPFLINGMVYGWKFSYTPKDNMRGVEESLEITEIESADLIANKITYVSPWIENNRLNFWCEYTRTDFEVQNYNLWNSISNPKIQGRGYGLLSNGFDGIKDAAKEALREAIRAYYRNTIKNKPKEITGSVLIKDFPTMGITSGRYVINLDFFLECGRIVEYTIY